MPGLMTKQDAINYLLYMKRDVLAESPMDIAIDTAIEALKQPTIEPEVRHGRWIPYGRDSSYNSFIRCSHCKHEVVMYADSEKTEPKYCEECGYRMGVTDIRVGGVNGYAYIKQLKARIAESPAHTLNLSDAIDVIRFYGLRNLFNAQGDIRFVGQVAIDVFDRAISNPDEAYHCYDNEDK